VNLSIQKKANAHSLKIDTEGAMTTSMLLGKMMVYSLPPGPTSCKDLLFGHKLSILYEDMLHAVDFPILIELNGGFDMVCCCSG